MNEDAEHAQLAQAELEERAQRECSLLRRVKVLTDEKKLTDAEFSREFNEFLQEVGLRN